MIKCRLCDANAERIFTRRILNKFDIGYFRCSECGSLQTEQPYWLAEAYSGGNLADTDTGTVFRSLNAVAQISAAAKVLGFAPDARVLDFGGGNGLLCRLLRDHGFDACWTDAYGRNELACGFDDDGSAPAIICSFEVAEHLAEPAKELPAIFERGAGLIILGTEVWKEQGPDWHYLACHMGQHIFFYTPAGMALLAKRFGYHYERFSTLNVFTKRPMSKVQGAILWRLLAPGGLRFMRAWLSYRLSPAFAVRDSDRMLALVKPPPAA